MKIVDDPGFSSAHEDRPSSIQNSVDAHDVNLPPINTNLQHPSAMISMSTGDLVPSKAPCPCNLKTNESKHWQSLCDACNILMLVQPNMQFCDMLTMLSMVRTH